jgi:EAL domain-containing protein (putative c-di-GMP-specific phosphodiesterase class I)
LEEARENLKEMVTELRAQKRKSIIPLVESAAILSTLWQAGVDYIQGYYLQAPTSEMNYDFSETD